jgi:putative membrane protein
MQQEKRPKEGDMSKSKFQIAALGVAGLLAVAPAFAQGTGTGSGMGHGGKTGTSGKMSTQDRKFVMEAAEGGMMEVELGRLAAQNASDPDVKAFGQRMVDDHSKANAQLMQIASEEGITLPTALKGDKKAHRDHMAKMTGAEFDKMYMSHMLKDHQKDVSEFDKESKNGQDSDVKQFAATTLPVLRQHLQMAETTASKVGASTAQASSHSGHR